MNVLPLPIVLSLVTLSSAALGQEKLPPDVAPLEESYKAKVKREVFGPHQKEVDNLLAKYVVEVGRALEGAQTGNKLEEMAALKAEKTLVAGGHSPPLADDSATPKTLKKLRSTFHLESARLDQERDRKWQPVRDEYAKSLEALVATLVRQGKPDDALAVRRIEDHLKSPALSIVGQWNIEHCGDVKSVWIFNKDMTYNYWKETGKYTYKGGQFHLTHTWDWDLRLVDDDTFEGVCTRGKAGCIIQGKRVK